MKRDLYFKELALVLGRVGFTSLSQENDSLPVEYQGQRLCRIDAQGNVFYRQFAQEKCTIFLVLLEEDLTKNFMAGLMIQNLSRELFTLADTYGGKFPNRVVFFCDELGTMPPFDILPLEKNYGKKGSEIIRDNTQDTIFGGFAPGSQNAEVLSKSLGSRTVQTGYINKSKNNPSQSLQMAGKPLMTPDELKAIPKGEFIVMKTGRHPMRTCLRLFLEWGITFEEPIHSAAAGKSSSAVCGPKRTAELYHAET